VTAQAVLSNGTFNDRDLVYATQCSVVSLRDDDSAMWGNVTL
jgi:hypothetical protein